MPELQVFGKEEDLTSLYSIDNLIYNLENLKEQSSRPQILLHKNENPLTFGLFVPCRLAWQVVDWLYTEMDTEGTQEDFILQNSAVDTSLHICGVDPDWLFEDSEDEASVFQRYVTLNPELQSMIKAECDRYLFELMEMREDMEREEELNRIMHPGMKYFIGDEEVV